MVSYYFFWLAKSNIFRPRTKKILMKITIIGLLYFLMLSWVPHVTLAQARKNNPKPGLKTGNTDTNQWWVGVRGGTNFSTAVPETTYSIFSYLQQPSPGDNNKVYSSYNLPGLQFGFSVSWEFIKGLSVNLLPSYTSYRFDYKNSFHWYDPENPLKQVSTNFHIETRLQYVELPLTIKYELMHGQFKPYIHAGGYYGWLTDAIKNINTTNTDVASGSDTEIDVTELSVGIEDRTKKANYGIIGGVGFTQNIGNARIGLEINYQYGLQNLDNGGMKFSDSQLITGAYDVSDDYSMNNLAISLQVIIPLKFITSKDYVPL
jgi:hypothetical protein